MYTTKTVDSQTTSPWIPLDDNQAAFNVSVAVAVTGTLTYTVQFTLDNIQDPSVTPVAFEVSSLTGKTADASTSLRSSVKAVRLNVTSYTSGSATIGVRQGTSWDGVDFATSSGPVTLFQSGIPFAILAGDGGVTGLSFTGTNAVFTLSAAVTTNFWNFFKTPGGGYMYLPASAGGLASGGWYFFRMTSETDGEVFQEMYPGTGEPTIPSSPTQHPNLTPGRITQVTTEVDAVSFVMPGGSMGPNGTLRALLSVRHPSSATVKTANVKVGSTSLARSSSATYLLDMEFVRQNAGVQSLQHGVRIDSYIGAGQTTVSGDYTAVDFSADQTLTFSLRIAANTTSVVGWLRECIVKYGA